MVLFYFAKIHSVRRDREQLTLRRVYVAKDVGALKLRYHLRSLGHSVHFRQGFRMG